MVWFEAGRAGGGLSDYGRAIDLLGAVLRTAPNNLVARFNRAMAYEQMFLFRQALGDWRRYVQDDPKSGWADRARLRIVELRKKLSHVPDGSRPPARLEPGDPEVISLLHKAYGSDPVPDEQRSEARSKLHNLASQFKIDYQDDWLVSLLSQKEEPRFSKGLDILYRASTQNETGDPQIGERLARKALSIFHAMGSRPGQLRAQFEIVYALQLQLKGRECLKETGRLKGMALPGFSPWFIVQASLEAADGKFMLGDIGSADREITAAIHESDKHSLFTLRLRAVGLRATGFGGRGRWPEDLDASQAGLAAFWSGEYPPYRAYQFYSWLSYYAKNQNQQDLELSLVRESVLTLELTSDRQAEAMERYRLARLAGALGDLKQAASEFARSSQLFASIPPGTLVNLYRSYGVLSLAQTDIKLGHTAAALDDLRSIEGAIRGANNEGLMAAYYSALGEAQMKAGDSASAEHSFQTFLDYGERVFRMLGDDWDRASWAPELDNTYRQSVRLSLDRNQPERALALWEWYRSLNLPAAETSRLFAQLPAGRIARIDALWARIRTAALGPDGVTSLTYVQMDDGIAAWVADERGIRYHWLPVARNQLTEEAQRFAEACSNPRTRSADLSILSARLYEQLLAPLHPTWPKGRAVLLELDGPSLLVPFDALQPPEGGYLGDLCSFIYSPGILFAQPSRHPDSFPRTLPVRLLAVGEPTLDSSLARQYGGLPDASSEAKEIASMLSPSVLLTGDRATLAAIRAP